MSGILDLLQTFTKVRMAQKQFADDRVDKLNRSTTVILFLIASAFILSRSFGKTIVCLEEGVKTVPLASEYINEMCYAQGALKLEDFFGNALRDKTPTTMSYSYPWLALISGAIAFLFYSPYLLWKLFIRNNSYQHVPVDINGIVSQLHKASSLNQKNNEFSENMKNIAGYLDRSFALNNFNDGYLDEYDEYRKSNDATFKKPKSYKDRINKKKLKLLYIPLAFKYLFIKMLYLAISIGVFPLIDILFGFHTLKYYQFGYETTLKVLGYYANNQTYADYVTSQYFPRHVLCKLKIRADVRQIHTYSYQCGLPANIFNEIVFLVLWFWLVILVCFNAVSLLKWIYRFLIRRFMIKDILTWPFEYKYHIDKYIKSFVYEYLSTEGFLVLMLIRSNTQDWYCRVLVRILWKFFMERSPNEVSECFSQTIDIGNISTANCTNRRSLDDRIEHDNITPVKTYLIKANECKNNTKPESQSQLLKNLSYKDDMV